MPVPVPTVHLGIGCATSLLALPLIFRKIPMNRFYGVRTPRAFVSERNWYALNAYGGKWLLAWGLFLVVVGLAGPSFAPPPTSAWAPVYMLIPLLTLVPVIGFINVYGRRLPDR